MKHEFNVINTVAVAVLFFVQANALSAQPPSSLTTLKNEIAVKSKNSDKELIEPLRDYIYLLSKEHVTPQEKLRRLPEINLLLTRQKFFRITPSIGDLQVLLKDFHVESISDLSLLHSTLTDAPGVCSDEQSSTLFRLGLEVDRLPAEGETTRQIKAETMCQIEHALFNNKRYGRKIAALALKQLAAVPAIPKKIKQDAAFEAIFSYTTERILATNDGDLFVQTLEPAIRIAEQTNFELDNWQEEDILPELARRCDLATALKWQNYLIDAALRNHVKQSILEKLRWQLNCAKAGKLDDKNRDLNTEQDQLAILARQHDRSERVLSNAKRFIELRSETPESLQEHNGKLLEYANNMVAIRALDAAELCLDACQSSENKSTLNSQIANTRIHLAELRGDLVSFKRLLDAQLNRSLVSDQDDYLETLALSACLNLLQGNYEVSEQQSRQLESQMYSYSCAHSLWEYSAQQKFVFQHYIGLLDRAQVFAKQESFEHALSILRPLLSSDYIGDNYAAKDGYALMARCYERTGHPGLARAAEIQACSGDTDMLDAEPSRLLADAQFQLAQVELMRGNFVRSSRYFSEALDVAKRSHLQGTALYEEIEKASQK
jgi:hypothetical protein